MEEADSTVGKKKLPSIPANYVSLAQLQERWIKEKEQKEREKNEQEQLQKQKQKQSLREFQGRRSERRQNRKPKDRRGKEESSRPEAVVIVTAAEGETNHGSLKKKKQTTNPLKKKENPRGENKEHIVVGTHEPPATSTAREDRRWPQRRSEGASQDPSLVVEQSFSRLSLNHRDRSCYHYGYREYSSNFHGGNYSREFTGHARVRDRGDGTPEKMMWVKKGRVADTDGDACENS